MTKRLKRVYSNSSQVCHVWAQQSQYYAKSSNCYFEGTKIYSYGSHYILGEITTKKIKGKIVVFLNDARYSVTTSKHQSQVSRALDTSKYMLVHLPQLRSWKDDVIKNGIRKIEYLLEDASKRRKQLLKDEKIREALYYTESLKIYCKVNGLKEEFKQLSKRFNNAKTIELVEKFKEKDAIYAELDKMADKERAKRILELKTKYKAWFLEEDVEKKRAIKDTIKDIFTLSYKGFTREYRVNTSDNDKEFTYAKIVGSIVVTTKGTQVKLGDALKLLKLYDKLVKSGKNYISPPDKEYYIDHYRLDYIKGNTGEMKLGCHTFTGENIQDFIKTFNIKL